MNSFLKVVNSVTIFPYERFCPFKEMGPESRAQIKKEKDLLNTIRDVCLQVLSEIPLTQDFQEIDSPTMRDLSIAYAIGKFGIGSATDLCRIHAVSLMKEGSSAFGLLCWDAEERAVTLLNVPQDRGMELMRQEALIISDVIRAILLKRVEVNVFDPLIRFAGGLDLYVQWEDYSRTISSKKASFLLIQGNQGTATIIEKQARTIFEKAKTILLQKGEAIQYLPGCNPLMVASPEVLSPNRMIPFPLMFSRLQSFSTDTRALGMQKAFGYLQEEWHETKDRLKELRQTVKNPAFSFGLNGLSCIRKLVLESFIRDRVTIRFRVGNCGELSTVQAAFLLKEGTDGIGYVGFFHAHRDPKRLVTYENHVAILGGLKADAIEGLTRQELYATNQLIPLLERQKGVTLYDPLLGYSGPIEEYSVSPTGYYNRFIQAPEAYLIIVKKGDIDFRAIDQSVRATICQIQKDQKIGS